jgi:hypothetical protein
VPIIRIITADRRTTITRVASKADQTKDQKADRIKDRKAVESKDRKVAAGEEDRPVNCDQ